MLSMWLLIASVLIAAVGLFVAFLYKAYCDAKDEVENLPKVPMLMCDTHGAYPEKAALNMEVPTTDELVKMCPFCVHERIRKHKVPDVSV
jgi:hypothetical protein